MDGMRVVDLDQQIFVPIVDETQGGVAYEEHMTVGEFLDKFCEEFAPEVVEAIPVGWMREFDLYYAGISGGTKYMNELIKAWQKSQGGKTA